MLILFDQGTPVPLRTFLLQHTVKTTAEQGWSTLANGKLLDAAEAAGFEVLVTTDKNLPHQQNLARRKLAIVVLGNAQWLSSNCTFNWQWMQSIQQYLEALPS